MDFQRYLLAKRSVDDRALNHTVYRALAEHPALQRRPLRVLEVGCGIGAMLERLLAWKLLAPLAGVSYVGVDSDGQSITAARERLPAPPNLALEWRQDDLLRPPAPDEPSFDLLIAHAVLDLLHLPTALAALHARLRPGGLAWLTLNFDGATIFEPVFDGALEAEILGAYHASMDARRTAGLPSGHSQTGRRLFSALPAAGFQILAAGPSDWVVFPQRTPAGYGYAHDEISFLRAIVQTVCNEPTVQAAIAAERLTAWRTQRLEQVTARRLTYIAHQLDFLVQTQPHDERSGT